MDVIILAGGEGSRMKDSLPKSLVLAKGKPILAHQIDYLLKFDNINKIIFSLGYKGEEIKEYINLNYPSLNVGFSINEALGTAGAIKKALIEIPHTDQVLVFNGDNITNINLLELEKFKKNTICVAKRRSPFGKVIEKDGYAIFEEKPILPDWTSCGWYIFNEKDILKYLPDKGSLEYDVFPKLRLKIYKHDGFCWSLNTKKDIKEFEKIVF